MLHSARLAFGALVLVALITTSCSDTPTAPVPMEASFDTENTLTGEDLLGTSEVFPSTNQDNLANGWAHVLFQDVEVGQVTLEFNQPRSFFACFEIRRDDEDPTETEDNFNPDVDDGLWEYRCLNGSSLTETIAANQHVDIRMAFGAEADERFDWTRFYVLSLENKDQCRDGAWRDLGFRNLGQCVRFVETGKDSRDSD